MDTGMSPQQQPDFANGNLPAAHNQAVTLFDVEKNR